MPDKLTPAQQRILDYLRGRIAADGRAPRPRAACGAPGATAARFTF
jgi:hypothetical protein